MGVNDWVAFLVLLAGALFGGLFLTDLVYALVHGRETD